MTAANDASLSRVAPGRSIRGLILDFDGVIADSETIANRVLARLVTAAGRPTSLADSLANYCGRRWPDLAALIETDLGRAAPADLPEQLRSETLAAFTTELKEVPGAGAFIRQFAEIPRCIASSSSPERISHCLVLMGMEELFIGRIFSAEAVTHGKPAPDIFLHAAERLNLVPAHCLVIEDSVAGVEAARAAGMTAIGFCGGSHVGAGHGLRLEAAGAYAIAASWVEATSLAGRFFSNDPVPAQTA